MQPLFSLLRGAAGKSAAVASVIIILIFSMGSMVIINGKQPLNSPTTKILLTLVVLGIAVIYTLVAGKNRDRKNAELAEAASPAAGGDKAMLANMDRAVRYLRQGKVNGQRVRLNELPWYVLIGPPGNGKTSALRSSGLRFPLREIIASEAYPGSHGTRNCTWWLSDSAVFLDTAGRYSVPETDGVAEAAEWNSFLRKLKSLRAPTPLNGILLMVGADSLLEPDPRVFRRTIDQLATRVLEILEMCGARIPVYVVVSKVDRLTGFVQVFEDDDKTITESPMGVTFEPSGGSDPLPQARLALEWLVDRVDRHVLAKVSKERNRSVAVNMLTFPRQLQASTERAQQLLQAISRATTPGGMSPWIRGFYLISSVQEGALINKLAQQIEADLGVSLRSDASEIEPDTRTYFLPGLFRDIILKEAGISGLSVARVVRSRWLDLAPHLAALGLAAILVLGFTWSFFNNRALVSDVEAKAVIAQTTLRGGEWELQSVAKDVEAFLLLLEATGKQEPNPPTGYRWFLYQGAWLHSLAGEQYSEYATRTLLTPLAAALTREMSADDAPVAVRFDALKCYVMLENPDAPTFDPKFIEATAERVWTRQYGQDPAVGWLKRGLARLLDLGPVPVAIDRQLVERTRGRLGASIPATLEAVAVERFKAAQGRGSTDVGLRGSGNLSFADVLGPEGAQIFRSDQLGSAIPQWMRGEALRNSDAGLKEQVARVLAEVWVLGVDASLAPSADTLQKQVAAAYANEFAQNWSKLIESLELDVPTSLAGIDTFLARVSPPAGIPSPLELALGNLATELRTAAATADVQPDSSAPMIVAKRFTGILSFVDGSAKPSLTDMRAILAEVRTQVTAYRATISDPAYAGTLAAAQGLQVAELVRARGVAASTLPSPMSRWFGPPMIAIAQDVSRGAIDQDKKSKAERAKPQCTDRYLAAYPFRRSATEEASVSEVADVFSPSGTVRSHITTVIKPAVQTAQGRWVLRAGSEFTGVLSDKSLEHFRKLEYFGDRIFPDGSRVPRFDLEIAGLSVPTAFIRIVIMMNGEEKEIFPKPSRLAWTADEQVDGSVSLIIESANSELLQADYAGTWGLFHFIDASLIESGDGNGARLSFDVNGEMLDLRLKSKALEELLREGGWRTLGCPQV